MVFSVTQIVKAGPGGMDVVVGALNTFLGAGVELGPQFSFVALTALRFSGKDSLVLGKSDSTALTTGSAA